MSEVGLLQTKVTRGIQPKELMETTIPIVFGILVEIGIGIFSLFPTRWWIKVILILANTYFLYLFTTKSSIMIKMIAGNGNF